jgi:hypothetical protein
MNKIDKYTKEYCDIEDKWLVGSMDGDMFTALYCFDTEDLADLMLFCLERVID